MCSSVQTKRKVGIAEEAAKMAFNILNRSSTSPSPKKVAKDKEGDKKEVKKGVGVDRCPALCPHCLVSQNNWKSLNHFVFILNLVNASTLIYIAEEPDLSLIHRKQHSLLFIKFRMI